ncbi:hypothetical protein C8R45DRAFT_1097690 [Mycena sanguinolenta]|nr:hypothetical protein C8R45DRAFT_1097690 [Mycena sanguinolenta]
MSLTEAASYPPAAPRALCKRKWSADQDLNTQCEATDPIDNYPLQADLAPSPASPGRPTLATRPAPHLT